MNEFLRQRYEALRVVLETPCLVFCERTLRIKPVTNAPRAHSMGAVFAQSKVKKTHRAIGEAAGRLFLQFWRGDVEFHVVRIIRIAPRFLDDDGLTTCGKHLRDGVASAFGVDDRDPCVRYVVDQRKGEPRQNIVRLELYASDVMSAVASSERKATKSGKGRVSPTPNMVRFR